MRMLPCLALVVGCDSGPPDVYIEPGRILYYEEPALVDAPQTAAIGAEITVTVMTYGGGCTSIERTDVEPGPDEVLVRPFDRRDRPDGNVCEDILRYIEHAATFTFATAGTKTIRVQGRKVATGVDEITEVPLSITVN